MEVLPHCLDYSCHDAFETASVIDVVAAMVMARIIYEIVYHYEDYRDCEKKRRLVW